jgi:sulfite reductase (NADPH) flavoprotein alpha-component
MIGAGTGVAPFRAFMQERAAQQISSKNWLFFGEKRQQHDFFYREDWASWLSTSRLSRLDLAFSRDRDEKVYVQHKIRQEGTTFFEWLTQGAHVYVCGSVAMGHAVRDTIRELVEIAGNLSERESENYLNTLVEEGRWHFDVY